MEDNKVRRFVELINSTIVSLAREYLELIETAM